MYARCAEAVRTQWARGTGATEAACNDIQLRICQGPQSDRQGEHLGTEMHQSGMANMGNMPGPGRGRSTD